MKRKILSLILVFAMTVSLLTVGTGAVEPTYGDTAGHWAESSIERWSGHGIIQGSNGLFDPNGQLTCAQLATILAKLLKLPAAKDAGFTDNTADAWYYDAVNRCAAAGILNGNGDSTVTPEAPITRERAMVMLGRALGIEPIRKPDLTKYTDAAKVAPYAQGMVAAMIEAGIVGGVTADELAPQDNINRASTVTILDRAISTYADKAGETVKADGKGLVLVVADDVTVTGNVDKLLVPADNVDVTVSGSKNIDDITVTGDNSKVILNNSTANDVTLDGKNTELETKSGSKVENVSVTEDAKGATVNAGSGTTIGTVDSKADNVSISGDGKVENASVSGDNTKVNTKDTKVDVDEGVTGTTAGGKEVAGGTTTETKPSTPSGGGSVHSHSYDAETLKCACGQFRDDVVATVGDTNGYTTLIAAVDAVLSTESKTGTVKLLKNATGSGIALKNENGATEVNLTIDFGDNTYTFTDPAVGSTGTETQGFHFEKNNTVVLKNGTLNVSAKSTNTKMLIQNYCNLTLDGMKVYGNTNTNVDYVASNNNGNIIIKDTTITANTDKCALDVYSFDSYTGANVTITGTSKINGKIEVGYSSGANTSNLGLTIKSGTINGAIVKSGAADEAFLEAKIAITGGTFSSDPSEYVAPYYKATKNGDVWEVACIFASGTGTETDPFHITSEAEWLALASQAYYSSGTTGQYYVVDKDLDFTGVTQKAGFKYFAGNIDFQGHTISGLNGSNTYTDRYPSLFKIVKAGATIKNLKYELPNLGTDYTVKPIGSIEGTGTVTLENIAISGNLNMTDNNTGLLVDFIGGNSKFDGTVNLIGCTSTCNMVNNGFSSVFIGGIYRYDSNAKDGNQITLNATNCVNYGKIMSTGAQASMLISNGTRHAGDNLTLNITNCRNEGQIIAAPGKSSYLAMPDMGSEAVFYTAAEIEAFESSSKIVNANGGISASLNAGELTVTDGKFDLTTAMAKAPDAKRFVLAFGFQGTGGLGGGGVTQYAFTFDSREAVMNVPAYSWVNASEATGELTAHNEYGTTYYTDEARHYVFNLAGYLMNNQPEVSFIAYDANGNVMLVDFYTYAK